MTRAERVRSKLYCTENDRYQTWLHSRLSLKRKLGLTTLLEELTGARADVSRARVFGCEAWVIIRRIEKAKWTLERNAESSSDCAWTKRHAESYFGTVEISSTHQTLCCSRTCSLFSIMPTMLDCRAKLPGSW